MASDGRVWFVNGDRLWTGNGPEFGKMAALADKLRGTKEEDNYAVPVVKLEYVLELEEQLKVAREALKKMNDMKPYRCMTCDGGERYHELVSETLKQIGGE